VLGGVPHVVELVADAALAAHRAVDCVKGVGEAVGSVVDEELGA